jgi:hypothetical protein
MLPRTRNDRFGSNPDHSLGARMSPSAECGHWSIFTPSKTHGEVGGWLRAQRQGLPLQRLDLGLQLGDALTLPHNVAMTMQSPLSPAADMPPHWLWAAMCQKRL